jgi:hypothetical protein
MGHEFMGEVVEVGPENRKLAVGDRVVVPFTIICGECDQCRRGYFSVCERTNRNKEMADKVFGHTTAGLFGYTHLTGGYPGGQAEYVRVPYADVAPVKIPNGLTDKQVLFLGDIFPTGWQAVVQCDVEPTDIVAIWGAGPVGQFCVRSAILLGARQVIVIDRVPERLAMAEAGGGVTENLVGHLLVAVGALADGKIAATALVALAANDGERNDDPIADGKLLVSRTDLDNLAHEFVTHDVTGLHARHEAVIEMKVRAADGAARHLDDGIPRLLDLRVGDRVAADVGLAVPAERAHEMPLHVQAYGGEPPTENVTPASGFP